MEKINNQIIMNYLKCNKKYIYIYIYIYINILMLQMNHFFELSIYFQILKCVLIHF